MARTAIVLGASGLIGNELLQLLLADPYFNKVKIFVRKKLIITHEKLEQHIINFGSLNGYKELIKGDVFFCCIGTTIKTAGSKEAFLKVDYEFPTEFAKIAKANGLKHFLIVSSLGADKTASNFYLKVKGDTEFFLEQLNFQNLTVLRPSLLLGKRNEFRFGETIAKTIMTIFSFIFIGKLQKYKPIEAITVAKAMLALSKKSAQTTPLLEGTKILQSDEIQQSGIY